MIVAIILYVLGAGFAWVFLSESPFQPLAKSVLSLAWPLVAMVAMLMEFTDA